MAMTVPFTSDVRSHPGSTYRGFDVAPGTSSMCPDRVGEHELRRAAGCRDAEQRSTDAEPGCVNDHVTFAPRSTLDLLYRADGHDRPTGDGHALEAAVGDERDVTAIRREERLLGA
jgi:hypothetical protein